MKKEIDIEDELERLRTIQPSILKCSYNFARKLKKERRSITDPQVSQYLSTLTIKPTDSIPDHIIFLCDERGNTLRMINLTTQPKEKPMGIH